MEFGGRQTIFFTIFGTNFIIVYVAKISKIG